MKAFQYVSLVVKVIITVVLLQEQVTKMNRISSSFMMTVQRPLVLEVSAFSIQILPPQQQRQYIRQYVPYSSRNTIISQQTNNYQSINGFKKIKILDRIVRYHTTELGSTTDSSSSDSIATAVPISEEKHVKTVLFVECGFGADAHGQNVTKAAVRACRNAIEFNQIPCIGDIIPGGRSNMKLDVLLGIPKIYQKDLCTDSIRQCFPYGNIHIQLSDGGLIASNGKVIAEMGDANDDMIIVCVAVTVGY